MRNARNTCHRYAILVSIFSLLMLNLSLIGQTDAESSKDVKTERSERVSFSRILNPPSDVQHLLSNNIAENKDQILFKTTLQPGDVVLSGLKNVDTERKKYEESIQRQFHSKISSNVNGIKYYILISIPKEKGEKGDNQYQINHVLEHSTHTSEKGGALEVGSNLSTDIWTENLRDNKIPLSSIQLTKVPVRLQKTELFMIPVRYVRDKSKIQYLYVTVSKRESELKKYIPLVDSKNIKFNTFGIENE